MSAEAQIQTDFSHWKRETLEHFARTAANDNLQLRKDVRAALDAYRALLREQTTEGSKA